MRCLHAHRCCGVGASGVAGWSVCSTASSHVQIARQEAQPIRRAADMDEDEASMLITGMFRRRIARNRVRLMAHAVFEKAYDETTGCFFYFNRRTQTSHWEKPKVLGEDDVELTPRSKEAVSQAASRAASRRSSADDGGGSMVHDSTHGSVQGSVHGSGQGSARGSSAGTHRQSVAESLGSELSLAGFLARHGLLQYRCVLWFRRVPCGCVCMCVMSRLSSIF